MKEVIKLDTVDQYNRLFGLETLHPLVSVVNLSEATRFPTHFTMNYGVYALFLKTSNAETSVMAGRFTIIRKERSPALPRDRWLRWTCRKEYDRTPTACCFTPT